MHDSEQYLQDVLVALPDVVFERMHQTVRSDVPLLSGIWMQKVDNEWCGCLTMDGYIQNKPVTLPHPEQMVAERLSFNYFSLLEEFYGVALDDWGDDFITAYDRWCANNYYVNTNNVVIPAGRDALRVIFDTVERMRTNVA